MSHANLMVNQPYLCVSLSPLHLYITSILIRWGFVVYLAHEMHIYIFTFYSRGQLFGGRKGFGVNIEGTNVDGWVLLSDSIFGNCIKNAGAMPQDKAEGHKHRERETVELDSV